MKFYAVRIGRVPGIYKTWPDCLKQIYKYPGAAYKKFESESEAQAFLVLPDLVVPAMAFPVAYADGGCRGNPGPGGCGAVLYDAAMQHVASDSRHLGWVTNNQAEYAALLLALDLAKNQEFSNLEVRMDSKLVVMQVTGAWKVKNKDLYKTFAQVKQARAHFDQFILKHIPRELNQEADRLANLAIDSEKKGE